VMATELRHFDMAVVQDGVLGGSDGAIYRRCSRGKSNYDMETAGGDGCRSNGSTRFVTMT
jgi:hypothetical protein